MGLAEVFRWLDVRTPEERPADTGVATNDIVRARFVLQEPLFVASYATVRVTDAFILIDGAANSTVTAGMVS